jgi:transcriptional regulator with GAF, ATPase, and Fis domain
VTEPLSRDLGATEAAKLVVLSGGSEGLERALVSNLTVGTDSSCDLRLSDRGMSRVHAQFCVRDGRVWVRDLQSRNGTYLEGARIAEAELHLGSVVHLAETPIGLYPRWQLREVAPSAANHFGYLHGGSLAMRELYAVLERVAASDATVLIEGESGTGKELVARSVHEASARAKRPYVVFDCTTVSKELAESELFGHARGAFSGAISERDGAFRQADGGTIFLDELGELPSDLQPKLLRVLETGEIRRVGETAHRRVNVRVLAATHRDLNAEARRGRFRSDLLYRLAVVRIQLPPLRCRPDDIGAIAERLLAGLLAPDSRIEGTNLQRLIGYSWPGNVRELRNVLTRAVALAPRQGGQARFEDLVLNLAANATTPSTLGYAFPGVEVELPYKEAKQQLMTQFEDEYVPALMKRHGGNVTRAALAAGLSRKHLHALLRRLESGAAAEEDE